MSTAFSDFEKEYQRILQRTYTANPNTLAQEITSLITAQPDVFASWKLFLPMLLNCAIKATADKDIERIVAVITAIAYRPNAVNNRDRSVIHEELGGRYETKPGEEFRLEGATLWSDLPGLSAWVTEWIYIPMHFLDEEEAGDELLNLEKYWLNFNVFCAFLTANPFARPSSSNLDPPRGLQGNEWCHEIIINDAFLRRRFERAEQWEDRVIFRAAAKWIEIVADRIYDLQFSKDMEGGRRLFEGEEGYGVRMNWERSLLEKSNNWTSWKRKCREYIEEFSSRNEELKEIAVQTVERMEKTEQEKNEGVYSGAALKTYHMSPL